MAEFSRLAIPLRNGELVFEEDGTIRFPDNCRVEGLGTNELRFYPRESSADASAPRGEGT